MAGMGRMVTADARVRPGRRLSPHLRGHLFLFDRRPAPAYGEAGGARLLLTAVVLEGVRLAALRWLHPAIPLWALVPLLLAFALLSVRLGAGLMFSQIGLRPWREWTTTERSYFLQVIVIANVVFPVVLAAPLRDGLARPGVAWTLWSVFVPYLFFGFYQELVYRGMLQLELTRRWGAFAGILVANALYTFGPLHSHYFASRASLAVPMFAAIFAIGLIFGVLFRRSGNLWIVAVMHAIGNSYIVGSLGAGR
jgi:membrane protease YdiL (CAAX protease family)